MKFGRISLAEARGNLLAHNVYQDGKRILAKGKRLEAADIDKLAACGLDSVYAARLEGEDVGENEAANRIAKALGAAFVCGDAKTGRVNVRVAYHGVLRIERQNLRRLNSLPGVTLATAPPHVALAPGEGAATLKIIPFALPEPTVAEAEAIATNVLSVSPLSPKRIHILGTGSSDTSSPGTGSPGTGVLEPFLEALAPRCARLGSSGVTTELVQLSDAVEEDLAAAIKRQAAAGTDLIIIVGDTAIMDVDDLAPAAIRGAGGTIVWLGAPVFPGNLLLLAELDGTVVLGAPGCARSPKRNVVDLLLPRLLTGERLAAADIAELGLGGLLAPR